MLCYRSPPMIKGEDIFVFVYHHIAENHNITLHSLKTGKYCLVSLQLFLTLPNDRDLHYFLLGASFSILIFIFKDEPDSTNPPAKRLSFSLQSSHTGCPQRIFAARAQRSHDMWILTSCPLTRDHYISVSGSSGLRVRALFEPPFTSPIWHCTPAVQRPNMDSVKERTVANPRKENQLVSPFSIILLGVIFYLYSLFFVKMNWWERFKKPKYEIFQSSVGIKLIQSGEFSIYLFHMVFLVFLLIGVN